MCAAMMEAMPRLRPPKSPTANTNSSIMETPVTIAGLTMGKLVMFIITRLGRRFMELMPMAAMVPKTVEAAAAATAMIRVLRRASRISRSSKSFWYHFREKPLQTVRLAVSVSLKEKTMSTRMGDDSR